MAVVLVPILLPLLVGLWFWSRPLYSGRWLRSAAWFASSALLLLLSAGVTHLVGSLAGASLDPEEACHRAGETFDRAYRRADFEEYTRWLPLHDKCHAGYDLVPAWVNPVILALLPLALVCPGYAVRPAVVKRRREKRGVS
ncbi:hypothetical protein [Streptomyces sp. M92]|uniref:hypothetical protein n=1 Tax=Streptomyces sp. M92 TaxID=2944250 RepID=UPI002349D55B|nr:hypothetical protein [Streptomyces sp. M92]WCN05395.1 hypothetical protein M6G08_26785 [Streptomyces sp. M92]